MMGIKNMNSLRDSKFLTKIKLRHLKNTFEFRIFSKIIDVKDKESMLMNTL